MRRFTFAIAAVLLAATSAPAQFSTPWGEVPREELFAPHFPEAPYAKAVVLLDEAVARVDEKNRLKIYRHHRARIFHEDAFDRGIVRIPYGKKDEIKEFRAQTIIPPGHIVEVEKKHRRVVEHPDGSRELVVEFPSLEPGVVIEYRYEIRRDELHTLPPWSFCGTDPRRRSRFVLMIPPGMSYDATFPWVPRMTPQPVVTTINDPEDPSREIRQIDWDLKKLPALAPTPLAGDPGQYCLTLFAQLREYRSEYTNLTIRREWSDVGDEVAARHAAFTGKGSAVAQWVKAAGVSGEGDAKARALFRLVRDGIRTDGKGPDLGTHGAEDVVLARRGTATAKNVLLAHLLREHGIDAQTVLVRSPGRGPLQEKYRGVAQFDHAVVRLRIDGGVVWADATERGCPYGLLPPTVHAIKGLCIAPAGGSGLVDVAAMNVVSGRETVTEATFDRNGTLHATCTVRFDGWEALGPRRDAATDGGEALAEAIVRSGFGDTAVLDSFTVDALERADEPFTLAVTFRVPDYAQRNGDLLRMRVPYLGAVRENPLTEGERELPLHLGLAGKREEKVVVTVPDGWSLPDTPARGSARSADLQYRVKHSLQGGTLTSTRLVQVIEPVVSREAATAVRGIFDKMVATDASELVLRREAPRTSSAR